MSTKAFTIVVLFLICLFCLEIFSYKVLDQKEKEKEKSSTKQSTPSTKQSTSSTKGKSSTQSSKSAQPQKKTQTKGKTPTAELERIQKAQLKKLKQQHQAITKQRYEQKHTFVKELQAKKQKLFSDDDGPRLSATENTRESVEAKRAKVNKSLETKREEVLKAFHKSSIYPLIRLNSPDMVRKFILGKQRPYNSVILFSALDPKCTTCEKAYNLMETFSIRYFSLLKNVNTTDTFFFIVNYEDNVETFHTYELFAIPAMIYRGNKTDYGVSIKLGHDETFSPQDVSDKGSDGFSKWLSDRLKTQVKNSKWEMRAILVLLVVALFIMIPSLWSHLQSPYLWFSLAIAVIFSVYGGTVWNAIHSPPMYIQNPKTGAYVLFSRSSRGQLGLEGFIVGGNMLLISLLTVAMGRYIPYLLDRNIAYKIFESRQEQNRQGQQVKEEEESTKGGKRGKSKTGATASPQPTTTSSPPDIDPTQTSFLQRTQSSIFMVWVIIGIFLLYFIGYLLSCFLMKHAYYGRAVLFASSNIPYLAFTFSFILFAYLFLPVYDDIVH